MTERVTLCWFRQDLRLHDQPALAAAAGGGAAVLPVYVLDDETPGRWAIGGAARWWLHGGLRSLADDLAALGAPLTLRRGRAADIIPALAEAAGAAEVHATIAHEPWWRAADAEIAAALARRGRRLVLHRAATLFDLDAVKTKTGGVFGIYGAFARAVSALPVPTPIGKPKRLRAAPAQKSDPLAAWALEPRRPNWATAFPGFWTRGEAAARRRLSAFIRTGVTDYAGVRNVPARPGTSRFSPYLHWGEVSARQVWRAAETRAADAS